MIKELKLEDLSEVYNLQNKEEGITEQLWMKCENAEDDLDQNIATEKSVNTKSCLELNTKPLECENQLESIKDLHLGLLQPTSDLFSNPQCLDFHHEESNIDNHFNPADLCCDFILNPKLAWKDIHTFHPNLTNENYSNSSESNGDVVLNHLVSNGELHLKSAEPFARINLNPANSSTDTALLNPLVLSENQHSLLLSENQHSLELKSADLHLNALLSSVQHSSNILKTDTFNNNDVDKQDNIERAKIVNNEKVKVANDEKTKLANDEKAKLVNKEKAKPVNNEKIKLANNEKTKVDILNVFDRDVLQPGTQGDVIIASKLGLFSNVSTRICSLYEDWLTNSRRYK